LIEAASAPADEAYLQRMRELLQLSVAVWQVDARSLHCRSDQVALFQNSDGMHIEVVHAGPLEHPVRWWVDWTVPAADGQGGGERSLRRKPCVSTLGMLRALRDALGAQGGRRVRIGKGSALVAAGPVALQSGPDR
jgi:hypothetical protein